MAAWEKYFVFYWGVCIKYVIPFALWYILLTIIKQDLVAPVGGYAIHWQVIGLSLSFIGLLTFFIAICLPGDVESELGELTLSDPMTAEPKVYSTSDVFDEDGQMVNLRALVNKGYAIL